VAIKILTSLALSTVANLNKVAVLSSKAHALKVALVEAKSLRFQKTGAQ
jgi:hypothetical protein